MNEWKTNEQMTDKKNEWINERTTENEWNNGRKWMNGYVPHGTRNTEIISLITVNT